MEHANNSTALPTWSEEIRSHYLSGAANQFILHGNVEDRLVFPCRKTGEFDCGDLLDFLIRRQLRKFDLVFTYDLGHGLVVQSLTARGRCAFEEWPQARTETALPREPHEAIRYLDHFLRYCSLRPETKLNVAAIIRNAALLMPSGSIRSANYEVHAMASLIRSWSAATHFISRNIATFLIADKLNELHPLVAGNPRVAPIRIPLPDIDELEVLITHMAKDYPRALEGFSEDLSWPAVRLAGATLSSVESLIKQHHYNKLPLQDETLAGLKKQLVERECQGLIEFVEPDYTLDDIHGNDSVTDWLREDIALWRGDDVRAMPMGYLICGPVGTGKTFLVECLAGEAGVPVVEMKNFRDRWVGSTEGNLEKIFALLHALGRCIVFIDEADQALGQRVASGGDSGVSGRVYSMMAKEMGDTRNRGDIVWILASSKPDLIEVDLKRPGRIDVKIPLFPTVDRDESYLLIRTLCKRYGVELPADTAHSWGEMMPEHVTPGAAETIAMKVYRTIRIAGANPVDALGGILAEYQSPISEEIMQTQIATAVAEASDLCFVPEVFRQIAVAASNVDGDCPF